MFLREGDLGEEIETDAVLNSIILGDCRSIMERFPGGSFDMVFLDPPYYQRMGVSHLERWNSHSDASRPADSWDSFNSIDDYDRFIREVISLSRRLLKKKGTLWVISTYHSIYRIGKTLQDMDFWILNDVIWVKSNPMPNWKGTRFTNSTETLIWALKDRHSEHTFREDRAREFGVGKIGSNIWVLPICMGKERVKDPSGNSLHSAQKPLELLRRIILTSTEMGDLILDPMAGLGTTGYAARRYKRNFVMMERDPLYAEAALKRMEERKNPKRGDNNPYEELEDLDLRS